MARLNIDYEELVELIDDGSTGPGMTVGHFKLWDVPPQGCSFTAAISMMHKRTLQLAELLETAIGVMDSDSKGLKP